MILRTVALLLALGVSGCGVAVGTATTATGLAVGTAGAVAGTAVKTTAAAVDLVI